MAQIALMAGTAALGGYTSYEQAKSQQEYQDSLASAQRKAVGIQNTQLSEQAALERLKNHNRANLERSKLRVAAGEPGIGYGGTYEALMRQADYDENMNAEIINRNLMNSIKASNSQLQPIQPTMNPLLQAFLGGMGGMNSGLSIGGSMAGFGGNPPKASNTSTPSYTG